MAITTTAYPQIMTRGRRAMAPSATRAGEQQRLARGRVAASGPRGAPVAQAREPRNDPGEGRHRNDRQVVPERRRAMEARGRDAGERLAQEHVAGEVRMRDRDGDEPGQ